MRPWAWVVQYITAMVLTLALGAILGGIQLFRETSLGATGLTASNVVQFLGYGGAVLLLWLLARAAARQISEDGKGLSFVRHVVEPLGTLIAVSVGYQVLLLLLRPFLGETGTTIYDWVFVLGIMGAALWLVWAGYRSSVSLMEVFAALRQSGATVSSKSPLACPQCGATIGAGMKFCSQCGQILASVLCTQCGHALTPGQKFCGSCGKAVG